VAATRPRQPGHPFPSATVTLALLGIGALGYGISIWVDLVYQVVKDDHVVKMVRMWSH
jgi:hypothetical protein